MTNYSGAIYIDGKGIDSYPTPADYEAAGRAVAANTARLRALRLAKEAADKKEEVAPEPGEPARQKRTIRSTS